jgi:uncharacterized protein
MAADRALIFGKRPAAGQVKTRLTPPLPPDEAAAFYEACLRDVVGLCARERARVELWYHPDQRAADYFAKEFPHILLTEQFEGDLGAKMCDAITRSFDDGAQRVFIVGSDVPTLPEATISAALQSLRDAEMVIGPTLDGGYYLIGFERTVWPRAQMLFDDVAWSTDAVYRTTIERATAAKLDLRVLPGWYDVDTIDDVRQALLDAAPESHVGRWAARPEAIHFINAG